MIQARIIIPSLPSRGEVVFADPYQIWRQGWEEQQPKWIAENIRFEHDERWRYRFWSIQSARDGNHWGWRVVRVTFAIGASNGLLIGTGAFGVGLAIAWGVGLAIATYRDASKTAAGRNYNVVIAGRRYEKKWES